MAKEISFKKIMEYINSKDSGNNCELITTEDEFNKIKTVSGKSNSQVKISIKCACGNIFTCSYRDFKHGNKRKCNKCSFEERTNQNKNSIEKLKEFVNKEGNGCILLSSSYSNNKEKLIFKCKCGNEFKTSWDNFYGHNVRQCGNCANKSKKINWNIDLVKDYIENESKSGCLLLSDEYKNISAKLKLLCSCGNEFEVSLGNFKKAGQRSCQKCRRAKTTKELSYTIEEIEEYLKNNTDCQLISNTYKNAKTPMIFKCACGNKFKASWDSVKNKNQITCSTCSRIRAGLLSRHSYEEVFNFVKIVCRPTPR